MKFAVYVVRILLCESCKFGEKMLGPTVTEIIIFS